MPDIFDTIETDQVAQKRDIFDEIEVSSPGMEKQNKIGKIFNVPGAAIRNAILSLSKGGNLKAISEAFTKGAVQPSSVPTFNKTVMDRYYQDVSGALAKAPGILRTPAAIAAAFPGMAADIGSQLADFFTNPAFTAAGAAAEGAAAQIAKTPVGAGISKFMTRQRQGPIALAKNLAKRGEASYITDDIAPQAFKRFQDNVQNFTPEIENFARDTVGVPESAIQTIKKDGVQAVEAARKTMKVDDISQRIQAGFEAKKAAADTAYVNAVSALQDNAQIDSSRFFQAVQRGLRDKGWIDLQGNPTSRYKGGLNGVADKLTDLYMDMKGTTTGEGKKISGKLISKEDFSTYRDALGDMLKEKPSDRLVMAARNALYDSAESAGMKGLKAARDLERQAFEAEKTFLDSSGNVKALGREGQLGKVHTLTGDKLRQLQEIEQYTGQPFVEDLKKVAAGQYLDKISEGRTIDSFVSDLNEATNRAKTNFIIEKYKNLLGPEYAKELKAEVIAHRQAQIAKKGAKVVGGLTALGAAGSVGKRAWDLTHIR